MLRMFALMHCSQVHVRRPRSTAADHVSGGGSAGDETPHVAQATGVACAGTMAPLRVGEGV